jgi:hypothetical protein
VIFRRNPAKILTGAGNCRYSRRPELAFDPFLKLFAVPPIFFPETV